MRTMKKVLALSLVLAMAFSLMAGAAFKDEDKINKDLLNDINMLIALNVFNEKGTGEGYFEPNGIVTREQAAKLLYVMKNKGVDNGAISWTGIGTFKDVQAGRWSEGYIEYCAATGMIVGDGTGNFNPTQPITGNALAKLLLVMIGYKADQQGYTGINWEANVMRDAETAGFYVEYDLPVRGNVTREWASKIMVNGINATKVKYVEGAVTDMYDSNNKPITFANTDLGMKEMEGLAISTKKFELTTGAPRTSKDGKTSKVKVPVSTDANGVVTYKTYEIDFNIPESLLGQEIKVLYKSNDSGITNTTKIYGVTATDANKVYNIKGSDITVDKLDANGLAQAGSTIKFPGYNDGKAVTVDAKTVNFYNNMNMTNVKIAEVMNMLSKTNYDVRLIDSDKDDVIDTIFAEVPVVGVVTTHNATRYRFTVKDNQSTPAVIKTVDTESDYKNLKFIDTIAEDDVVAITKDYSTGVEVLEIAKVDYVEGKITSVNSSNAVTINGTQYKAAGNYISGPSFAPEAAGKEVKYYVIGNRIVYATTPSAKAPTNLAMVIGSESGGTITDARVKVILNDGKTATYNLNTGSSAWIQDQTKLVDKVIYEYKLGDSNDIYLRVPGAVKGVTYNSAPGMTSFNKNTASFTVSSNTSVKITDDSYFFMIDDSVTPVKYSVVKGSEVKSLADGAVKMVAYNDDNIKKVLYGRIDASSVGETTSAAYAFATGDIQQITEDDGDIIVTMDVTTKDGQKVTLKIDDETISNYSGLKNAIVKYEINSNGYATVNQVKSIPGDLKAGYYIGSITGVDGNVLEIKYQTASGYTSAIFTMSSDCVVNNVKNNTAGTKPVWQEGKEIVKADGDVQNVIFKTKDTTGTDAQIITEIIVEVDGKAIATVSYNANSSNP